MDEAEPMSDSRVIDRDDPANECFLLSLEALSRDWNRPEEDLAWAYLQDMRPESDETPPAP